MLHKETVEAGTLGIIEDLLNDEAFKDFYLVGGTALSLKLAHRKSIDIDLFTHGAFDAVKIKEHLENNYQAERLRVVKNGVFGFINSVKLDMISHQYPPQMPIAVVEGIRMVSLEDIGAMKLHAIVQNGARLKDFVDINYLLEHKSLSDLLRVYDAKYPESNKHIAQNALLYHHDINFDVPVQLIGKSVDWKKIDQRLREAVASPGKTFKKELSVDIGKPKELKQKQDTIEELNKTNRKGRRP